MNEAVRFYARAQLRSSWHRRVVLVVLLGAIGAVSIGSAAGAVRTSSAVNRFLTEQRAFDVLVFCRAPERGRDGFVCEQELRDLDEVEDTAPILELFGLPSVEGRNAEPADDVCFDGPGDLKLIVSPDGRFGSAINEHRFIAGRAVDPSHADEVVISRDLAERIDLGVGDTIDFRLFAGADCNGDSAEWRPATVLTVVGIEISPFEVRPESGEYRSFVHATPALLAGAGDLPDTELMVAARLRTGVEFEDLRESFKRLEISMEAIDEEGRRFAVPQSVNSDNLQRSVRAHVTAQWLLGALTAAAGLVLVGQMLNRQIRGAATEFRTLGHLGLTRRDLSAVGLAHLLSVVLPAALLAALGGYLISSFTPLGIARVVEVNRGLRAEPVVLGLGTSVMILGLVGVAIPSLVALTRGRVQAAPSPKGRTGAVARRLGGGPVTTTGLRMAFEPLRGSGAPPLRTGFGMVLAAVVLLVAATVFAGSVTHLQGSKHLIGWNWDALLYVEDEPVTDARLREVVGATPGVLSATSGTIFTPVLLRLGPDEVFTPTVTFDGSPIGPTLISGRAPSGPSEIVLGRQTLARLGYREGDRIPFLATTGVSEDLADGPLRGDLTIVGTAVLPVLGGDNRLGTGAAIDFEFVRALAPEAQTGAVFMRLEAGARLDEVASAAADTLGVGAVGTITEETFGLDRALRDVEQIRSLPIAFAVMLALLAVGVVAQVVVGSTHARREELRVLRALGLRPRQIRGAIVVQAVAVSGSALLVGLPLGIALGRGAWQAFALSLGTKPEVSLASGWLAALAVSLLVLASLLGLICSRPRRQLAAALRRE
jgi:ABC-type lipoprotein release transport system permease subunit